MFCFRTSRGTFCDFSAKPFRDFCNSCGIGGPGSNNVLNLVNGLIDIIGPEVNECKLRGAEGVAYNVHYCYDTDVKHHQNIVQI